MHARAHALAPWTTLTTLILTTILVGCTPPVPPVVSYEGPVADWPAYGATPGGLKYSAANQITADNVQYLEKAWEHNSGVTGDWAAGIELPYVDKDEGGLSANSIGDLQLFTKYRFWRHDTLGAQHSALRS